MCVRCSGVALIQVFSAAQALAKEPGRYQSTSGISSHGRFSELPSINKDLLLLQTVDRRISRLRHVAHPSSLAPKLLPLHCNFIRMSYKRPTGVLLYIAYGLEPKSII